MLISACKQMFTQMNNSTYKGKLRKLGLSDVETDIYLSILRNGPQTALELSKNTSINRTKIYRITKSLKAKGLIEETNVTWGKTFNLAPTDKLKLLVEEQEKKLAESKKVLPDVLKQFSKLSFKKELSFQIKNYRGVKGLRQIYWNTLKANKILVFGYKTRNEPVGRNFAEKTRLEQIRKKIHLYELENKIRKQGYKRQPNYTDLKNWQKYYHNKKIKKDVLTIRHHILIYNTTVAIINWHKSERIGLEIVNKPLNRMYRQFFWNFWDKSSSK